MEKDDFEIAYELFLKKEDLNHSKNNLSRFCTIWNTQLTLYQIKAKRELINELKKYIEYYKK